jgi:hypothetical protein
MFVALVIQHEMRIRHIVICALTRYQIFIHTISLKHNYGKKKLFWTQSVCFDFLYNFCLKQF